MNIFKSTSLSILATLVGSNIPAADLEITLRTYPKDRVVFADPLYLEFTIVNKGQEIVTAPRPIVDIGTLEPRLREPGSRIEMICADEVSGPSIGTGPSKPVQFLPGKPVKLYTSIFLPNTWHLNDPFWKEARDAAPFHVWAVYWQSPNVALWSNRCRVDVMRRDEEELKALEYWLHAKEKSGDRTPVHVSAFQISLAVFRREQTREVAKQVPSGELGELLRLTVRLQDLCATPKEAREAPTRELVEWLKKLPDIKRQAVTNAARAPIMGCIPFETAKELQSIAEVDY